MKRIAILLAAFICGVTTWADTIDVRNMGIRYYLPKTEATLHIQTTRQEYRPGKYAQWADQLLGIEDVITRDSTACSIGEVRLSLKAVPDKDRVYTVLPQAGKDVQLLSVTKEGLLSGYNIPAEKTPAKPFTSKPMKDKTFTRTAEVPSLGESTFKNDSLFVQARAVAKQIFQLRDNRAFLLSGELENMPSDGAAVKAMLNEMDKQEKALTSLFTGSVTTSVHWEKIAVNPALEQDTLLCVIGQDSLQLNITVESRVAAPVTEDSGKKAKKGAPLPSQIYYNLPGNAHIIVRDGGRDLLDKTVSVAQLGVSVPLSEDLFVGEPVHIVFDPKTGNILSITRGK